MNSVTVRAPATSANLGPGFDCLGIALSLFSDFTFEQSDRLLITGCDEAYCGTDNLVYRAFCRTFEKAGELSPFVHITIQADIPVARGLGSSSTCIVSGILAANAMLGGCFSRQEMFMIATEMEGHPDNAAPCIFGGLTASFTEEEMPHTIPFRPHPDWRFVTLIPDYEVRTEEARAVLRQETSLSDSVFSLSHAIGTVRALETGDGELLGLSCRDVLHEPYRRALIPDYDRARALCLENGAEAFFISGSGSTMIAPVLGKEKAGALSGKLAAEFPRFRVESLLALPEGARILFR